MKKLSRFVQCFVGLSLVLGFSACGHLSLREDIVYPVVATRNLSGVAMSLPQMDHETSSKASDLIIGSRLRWIDGTDWSQWTEVAVASSAPGADDTVLADVYYRRTAASVTKRYESRGQLIGTVHWIDDRVGLIVAPAGSPVWVIERELDRGEAAQLEAKLKEMKFDSGPVDGVVDAQTRRAIGFYLEYRGLSYRFASPVISRALLAELLVPVRSR